MEGKIRVSVVATRCRGNEEPAGAASQSHHGRQGRPCAADGGDAGSPGRGGQARDRGRSAGTEVAEEPEAEIEVDAVSDSDETTAVAVQPAPAPAPVRPEPQPAQIEPSIAFRRPETPAPAAAAPRPAPAPRRPPAPARAEPTGRRVPFIPPKPMTPNAAAGSEEREPSIMTPRSGEHVNELGQPTRRRSLFERMTGVSRGRDSEGDGIARSQREALEPRLHNTPAHTENPAPKAAPENPPARTQAESRRKTRGKQAFTRKRRCWKSRPSSDGRRTNRENCSFQCQTRCGRLHQATAFFCRFPV